jgi:hypothetical protein
MLDPRAGFSDIVLCARYLWERPIWSQVMAL